jgi:hypothetical protein
VVVVVMDEGDVGGGSDHSDGDFFSTTDVVRKDSPVQNIQTAMIF